MPFALVTVGILFIVVGFQDTYKQLGAQVQKDFTGKGNFIYWLIAIGVLGAIGYVKEFQTFSRAMITLLIVALFLSKKTGTPQGITFFQNFTTGVKSGTTSSVDPVGTALQGSDSNSSSTSGDNGSNIMADVQTAATIAEIAS
jgi:hypothetical protein